MSLPFTYAGTLSYPVDDGVAPTDIPVAFSGIFDSENKYTFKLTGSGTQAVDFGTIAVNGAKLIQVEVDPDPSPAAQPVFIQINGEADGQLELAPGSFLTYGNSKPTAAGILSLNIVY